MKAFSSQAIASSSANLSVDSETESIASLKHKNEMLAKEMKIKELEAETAARMDLIIWIRPRLSQNREPPFFSTTEAHQCKAVFGCVPGVAHPATSHACQTRRPLLSLNR